MDDRAHVHELVGETLAGLGHRTLFGLLGSGNFKFADHFTRACGGRWVWLRHEAAAVAAADAFAQVTRGLGLATVHQGPGFTNALTALAQAVKERTPLLLVAGATARGRDVNQTLDQAAVARSLGAAVEEVRSGPTAVEDVERAVARARAERIPVVLSLPLDLQEERGERREARAAGPLNVPRGRPAPVDVEAAVDLIARSERPAIVPGRGAVLAGARAPLEALGERVGAVLATSLVGNGLFAGHPRSVGVCGGFSSPLATRVLRSADLVLAFGASLNQWTTMHGSALGDADVVQCDADRAAIARHQPARLGLVGDAAECAEALLEELERRGVPPREPWEREAEAYVVADDFDEQPGDGTIDPRRLVVELDRRLPAERTVVYDGGHFHWFPTAFVSVPDADGFVAAQGFQAVGLGLGTAVGAAAARPDRPVLALVGDGGAMMALGELDSIAAQGLPVVVAIFNDGAYGAEVHHFAELGLPTDLVEFGDRDFAAVAAALGASAATVRSPDDVGAALDAWEGGPLVLDCKVNPAVRAERLAEAFKGGA
jgi:thiamine pyrophosphate-dependent acetolactate synthase large subunit-like protein